MKFFKCLVAIVGKYLNSLIYSGAIIAAALIYAERNPYESCKRDLYNNPNAAIICAGSGSLVLYLLTILNIYLIDLK